ncbi:O-antigen ligase family protein [Candidatus Uhrbacteria bacterium]|nr:MAG: O-antigen ligase family protein [Candidatus Uhrbacteria bacterium]
MNRSQAIKFFKAICFLGIYGGLLLPLVFIPVVIFPFVFSKLIFFQVLVGLTFPAYLALVWMEPSYRPKKHVLFFAILAYFVAIGLSVVFAVDPYRAWWGNQERMNGLFTLLHFLAWLTMTVGIVKTWEQWKTLLHYQVGLSAIMAIVAILQKMNPNLLLFPAGPRVGGLLDNPIYMAAYQIFNFFFLALLFWKNPNRNWRVAYGLILVVDIIAFILAQSRGALMGLAAGIVAFAFYTALFTTNKKLRYGVFGLLLAMFAGYGALYLAKDTTVVRESPLHRYVDFQGAVRTRLIAWDIAWQGFVERPLTGWGFDNFHVLFNLKYNPISLRFGSYETWFDRAHNTVMDVLSMTGIFGFVTFFGIYGAIFYSTWRAFRKKWIDLPIAAILFSLPVAYFVQNLFVFDHPAGFSMSYLLFALIIAATKGGFIGEKEAMAEKHKETGIMQAPWTAFVVLMVVMGLLVLRTSVNPFQVSRKALQANAIFSANPQMSYQIALEASKTWTPYLDEQSFLLSRNMISLLGSGAAARTPNWKEMYELAKTLSLEEIARHPRNTHPRFIFARLAQEVMGLIPAEAPVSERMYQEAIATSPKRQQLHYGLARLYLMTGNLEPALNVFRNVISFDTEFGEGYWNLGITLMYDKRELEAGAENVQKALSALYPYRLQSPRELVVVADSLMIRQDDEGMKTFISKLGTDYPLGTADVYAQLVYKLQVVKKDELAQAMLAATSALDPATPKALQALINQANGQTTPTPAPAPTSAATGTAPIATATYNGLRR